MIDARAFWLVILAAAENDPEIRARLQRVLSTAPADDAPIPVRKTGPGWRRVLDAVRAGELPGFTLDGRGTIGVKPSELARWRAARPFKPAEVTAPPADDDVSELRALVSSGRLRAVGGGRK